MTVTFQVAYQQFIDEQGKLIGTLPECINNEILLSLYKKMQLTRAIDNKAITMHRTGRMRTYPASIGQEAVGVSIGLALQEHDVFIPYYRDTGALIQRGAKPEDIYRYWGGDERGSDFATHREDFPICVPIATQYMHACGVASAIKLRGQARAALTVCGDGGTSKGDFYEALNVAGAWHLPVVFVVNNNQWAISVPREKQTACETLAQKAIAGGFTGIQVDGNDAVAMYAALHHALQHARENKGPMLIEALTYRICDHTTVDDARRYRNEQTHESAKDKEPLKRLRLHLESESLWDQDQEAALLDECQAETERAVQAYLDTPAAAPESVFDYHYETWPKNLEDQRQALLAGE